MTDNPPAFPSVAMGDPGNPASVPGMTLRDWFAGQALSGMLSSESDAAGYYTDTHHAADRSYGLADAMLAERVKGGEA